MNSFDVQIREKLVAYLTKEFSLDDFKDWFVPTTWEVEKSNSEIAISLTREIELLLAELSNGHWTEQELREKLAPLVQQYDVVLTLGTSSTEASCVTDSQSDSQFQDVGTVCEVEYA